MEDVGLDQSESSIATLRSLIRTIEVPLVLLRADSFAAVTNDAADELLDIDSPNGMLAREIRSISQAALDSPTAAVEVDVETEACPYRLRAKLVSVKLSASANRFVLVSIVRPTTRLPSRDYLIRRFGMTNREGDVALLLARGTRNATIAVELHISIHTARHHTESVLLKLNVHGRAEVARAIMDGGATSSNRSDDRMVSHA
jgi:DNA-binding CsgD family transcriptional regulator